jgi:hypothetical protein
MTVDRAPQRSRSVVLEMRGRVTLMPDGWYRLDLARQGGVGEDLQVSVTVARGWRITDTRGLDRVDGRRASSTAPDPGGTLFVRVERTGVGRIWDRLTRR